jgi:HPt (histidine-containing phosphotransfer) domain-containing protein
VTTDDEVEREIAELRRAYRAEVPSKVATIARAVQARDREGATTLAHRLRGTAGSYGLAEVSAVAGAIEDALTSTTPDWSAIDGYVAELTAAADR